MPSYLVTWEIDIEAETPLEAAQKAREIQLRPDSSATVFDVNGERIDLEEYFTCDWCGTAFTEDEAGCAHDRRLCVECTATTKCTGCADASKYQKDIA